MSEPRRTNPYDDLKAMAGEHGAVPAFRVDRGAPGRVTSALLRLYDEGKAEGFVRLVIDDSPNPDESQQFIIELERLRALLRDPQPPLP
jgi:hypothetical protein